MASPRSRDAQDVTVEVPEEQDVDLLPPKPPLPPSSDSDALGEDAAATVVSPKPRASAPRTSSPRASGAKKTATTPRTPAPRKPRATGSGPRATPARTPRAKAAPETVVDDPATIPAPGPPPPLPPVEKDAATPEAAPAEAEGATVELPPVPPLPEPVVAEPVPVVDVEPESDVAEPEPVVAAPEPGRDPTPEVEPEPEPVAEIEPQPEAVVETEPEAVVEIEPEAVVETDPEAAADDDLRDLAVAAAVIASDEAPPAVEGADPTAAAISLRGVVKQFGETRAVDGIDLTIPAGSFYGIVGPNGAGKTTTLSMIAGLLAPDRGTISVCGVDATADPARAKRMLGVLPDRLRTFDRLTGHQLLYYYGVLRGLKRSVVETRLADLARAFDLTDSLGRPVSDYSAGMTKKVMLAGAMIHSPRVLVLDEPFEAVDPASSQVILDILGTYVAHGGTVVLSSHGMALVERVCTQVAVLVGGQVLAEGPVEEVRGDLSLEERFIQLSGGLGDVEGLEWLHTFSD